MHAIQLLSNILKGKWLIEPNFALTQGSIIASVINGQIITEQKQDELSAFAVSAKDVSGAKYSWYNGFDLAPAKSVAVISIKGALMKEDMSCGPIGTATIGQIIQSADNHANIDAIVLHIDSPGGTVDGTEALANIIKNTHKPVVAFVDGLMASAALWVGSSADEIIASTDTDEIGSVGVISSFADMQPYWENLGIKFHSITASTSPDKRKMWEDLRAGKYEDYIKAVLDPLDAKFMETVKKNRPKCEDQHLTGKVYFARDVMGVFVDSIGTLQDAILRASELANTETQTETETEISNNLNNNSMKQFAHLNTVLGIENLESVDESVSLNEDQLELIDVALQANDQAIINARTEAELERDNAVNLQQIAEEALAGAYTALDEIDQTIAAAETPEAKAEAVRILLSAIPGVKTEVHLEKKDADADLNLDADWEAINNLPHNREVDENS